MKILILDDDENRLVEFEQRMKEKNWEYDLVTTANEAKELVSSQPYDMIFLDHDLGGEVYVDSNREDTGAEVARHIVAVGKFPKVVIAHSLNPGGRDNIRGLLEPHVDFYEIPFVWIRSTFHSTIP